MASGRQCSGGYILPAATAAAAAVAPSLKANTGSEGWGGGGGGCGCDVGTPAWTRRRPSHKLKFCWLLAIKDWCKGVFNAQILNQGLHLVFLPAACGMVIGWVVMLFLLLWGRLAFGRYF